MPRGVGPYPSKTEVRECCMRGIACVGHVGPEMAKVGLQFGGVRPKQVLAVLQFLERRDFGRHLANRSYSGELGTDADLRSVQTGWVGTQRYAVVVGLEWPLMEVKVRGGDGRAPH